MVYEIRVHETASQEIDSLRVFDQRKIVGAVEKHLSHQPAVPTRHRKLLKDLTPQFEHVPPVWELRVGYFRIFYDIDERAKVVHIRAVRQKEASQRTEDIT